MSNILKLGKKEAKLDSRNLKFASVFRVVSKLPKSYGFDTKHKNANIPLPMFANDTYGDCVIAGRAHQTIRFEYLEQNKILEISDKDVIDEYFQQTGGVDSGLVVLDSLKEWRNKGWKIGSDTYKIKAFVQINPKLHDQIKQAIYTDVGIGIGLSLPLSASDQLQSKKPWSVVTGNKSKENSWGGHYVHVIGYTEDYVICVTWGAKQKMTWEFFDKYCDEAYGIIDDNNSDKFKTLETDKLSELLSNID